MTIKELYKWAKEKGYEDFEIYDTSEEQIDVYEEEKFIDFALLSIQGRLAASVRIFVRVTYENKVALSFSFVYNIDTKGGHNNG